MTTDHFLTCPSPWNKFGFVLLQVNNLQLIHRGVYKNVNVKLISGVTIKKIEEFKFHDM